MQSALQYMVRQGPQNHITENYVSSPPALTITDDVGDLWCLGFNAPPERIQGGEYSFSVLRNGMPTGEFANRIERRAGRISIFTADGWKRWRNGSFV